MWPETLTPVDKRNLQQRYETAKNSGDDDHSAKLSACDEVVTGLETSATQADEEARYAEGNGYYKAKGRASGCRRRVRVIRMWKLQLINSQ